MKQRLIWNFEFTSSKPKKDFPLKSDLKDTIKWEKRFFWPSHKIITLNQLDEGLLELSNYEHKSQEDCYFILPDKDYNIKLRRKELLYKPVLDRVDGAVGFGPKVLLKKSTLSSTDEKALLDDIKKNGTAVLVKKEGYVFKFSTHPAIKLELSRLKIGKQEFFSICVEGRSLKLVEMFSQLLLKKKKSSEYVKFLKESLNYDG